MAVAALILLSALTADRSLTQEQLPGLLQEALWSAGHKLSAAASLSLPPTGSIEAPLQLLRDFGAVDDGTGVTALGAWICNEITARAPQPVTADLPADEVLRRLAAFPDGVDFGPRVEPWLRARTPADAAGELLRAASRGSPVERVAAVVVVADMDEAAGRAWQSALQDPNLAAHARFALCDWDPDALTSADRRWLAVERALVEAQRGDLEEARILVQEQGGMRSVEKGGHPGCADLTRALSTPSALEGDGPPIYQLRVTLRHAGVWRRVLIPAAATLGLLHEAIQVLMGWDGGHLHGFTADGVSYSDPSHLDDCVDEDSVRLSHVLPRRGAKMSYTYDFGDEWRHDITLEKILESDGSRSHPLCIKGAGDAPVEDWNEELDGAPEKLFDREVINARLASLTWTVEEDGEA